MKFGGLMLLLISLLAAVIVACGDDGGSDADPTNPPEASPDGGNDGGDDDDDDGGGEGSLDVTSLSIKADEPIPVDHTCDGDDLAPAVKWSEVPEETKSVALVMEDVDADDFVHWLVYDIPVKVGGFEVTPDSAELPSGAKQAENDFGNVGYGGPCPPEGEEHTYRIRVLALDGGVDLDPGAKAADVLAAIEGTETLDSGDLRAPFARE
jgi:Raf kinase inhibitor-like YbhB/YbcL family protein